MQVRVRIVPGGEERVLEIEGKATVRKVLNKLGLSPDEYVVTKNGEVVVEDEEVVDGDLLEVYRVVSGG
ncbi:MAG: MoaD/ThiS family protein [Desulfurococcales archaeon]|nr:MoaD/ThiS family protein [Desulfurococcales archaeon]